MFNLKKIGVVSTLCAAVFGMSFAATTAFAQEHKFKMATGWAGGPLMEIGAKAFADRVKEASNGRIEVEVFAAGTLGRVGGPAGGLVALRLFGLGALGAGFLSYLCHAYHLLVLRF